jgi:branched-chain amino acid transport system substrate-binding protein
VGAARIASRAATDPDTMSVPRARPPKSLGRRARPVALAAVALALGLVGCGGGGSTIGGSGDQLTIYSSLPLQGASASISQEIVNGEKLALAEAGGHVGPFTINYASLDDSSPTTGVWDPGITASNAKMAAQDVSTIAYLGDYNSGASAISLPLMNAAGILQISPASPYVGLTSSFDAGQDEPARFYPTGKRTFGRLMPDDQVQAAALVKFMQRLGVGSLYVLKDTNPFEATLADIVATDAKQAGIQVVGDDVLDTSTGTDFSGEARQVAASGASAVFFGGGPGPGSIKLWQQLYAADPQLKLLGSSAMIDPSFTSAVGAAGQNTYMTTPLLARRLYPPAAQRFFRLYRRRFGVEPQPYVLYGYESMQVALLAIRNAGSRGNDRQAVVNQFFDIRNRNSVLGRYSIDPSGDTTLSDYGVDRLVAGRPVFVALMTVPAAG